MRYLITFFLSSCGMLVNSLPYDLTKIKSGGVEVKNDNVSKVTTVEPEIWKHCSNQYGIGGAPNNCEFTHTRNLRICSTETGVCSYKISHGGHRQCSLDDFPYKAGITGSLTNIKCSYGSKVLKREIRKPEDCENRHDCAGLDLNLPIGSEGTKELRVENYASMHSLPDSTIGAFRINCGTYSHYSYEDPLLYPQEFGRAHLHQFVGNTSTTGHTTGASLSKGKSTCVGGSANKSAYWIPAMIDVEEKQILPGNRNKLWYYKGGYRIDPKFERKAPPKGLSIISHHAWWKCTDNQVPSYESIPTHCPVGETIKLSIEFPECWDGQNLWLPDQTHMTFPSGVHGKMKCPSTHRYLIPTVGLNLAWKIEYEGQAENLRLSSDMDMNKPGGATAHADVIFSWDEEIIQRLLDNCINAHKDCGAHNLGDGKLF